MPLGLRHLRDWLSVSLRQATAPDTMAMAFGTGFIGLRTALAPGSAEGLGNTTDLGATHPPTLTSGAAERPVPLTLLVHRGLTRLEYTSACLPESLESARWGVARLEMFMERPRRSVSLRELKLRAPEGVKRHREVYAGASRALFVSRSLSWHDSSEPLGE